MKILVVDDVEEVRKYIVLVLTGGVTGVEIEQASDGDEALWIYCERGPYDLVMTDLFCSIRV